MFSRHEEESDRFDVWGGVWSETHRKQACSVVKTKTRHDVDLKIKLAMNCMMSSEWKSEKWKEQKQQKTR